MSSTKLFIGLLSGTSVDSVDAALFELSASSCTLIASVSHPWPEVLKDKLLACYPNTPLSDVARLDIATARVFAEAVLRLLETSGKSAADITAIGSHGQTLIHNPAGEYPYSIQIGDPSTIAAHTGITTVAHFRQMDIAVGGQGAPLAPAFHAWAFAAKAPCAILNIGGIANLSILRENGQVTGFDSGPGNTLIDLWVRQQRDTDFDANGDWARSGTVHENLLTRLLSDPYLAKAPPKSTGPDYFSGAWLSEILTATNSAAGEDIQATLTEYTARSVAQALEQHGPFCPDLYVCGGGSHNGFLMERIQALLPSVRVATTQALGLDPDWVEAALFAWLAKTTLENTPNNAPDVTGAKRKVVLGGIFPGNPS